MLFCLSFECSSPQDFIIIFLIFSFTANSAFCCCWDFKININLYRANNGYSSLLNTVGQFASFLTVFITIKGCAPCQLSWLLITDLKSNGLRGFIFYRAFLSLLSQHFCPSTQWLRTSVFHLRIGFRHNRNIRAIAFLIAVSLIHWLEWWSAFFSTIVLTSGDRICSARIIFLD